MFLAPQVWLKPLKRALAENALILAYFNHSLPSHHGVQKEVILDEVFDHRCMPSTYPATFHSHELAPVTRSTYVMTGPEGEQHAGYFLITEVDEEAKTFSFDDGFCDLEFNPIPDMPVSHNVYSFTEVDGVTHARYTGTYASAEALQATLDMGVVEGASSAIDQIDALVAS